ncbi:MAG: hypothetical protein IM593_09445 [Pseudanabaena sp. M125S2SP2A07QC]|nr:hypothetical protein [Pseudanabaena sp. M125S2SP2A07QC]MCA6539774.1 hypothetical protein [Pseudanabaena sp. M037S2SP2A07QC]
MQNHYENDFAFNNAVGAGNTKIGFLKARRRWAFKKPIFIMRITALLSSKTQLISQPDILGQKQSLLLARIQYLCDRYLHFFLPYVYF